MKYLRQLSAAAFALCLMVCPAMALTIGDPAPAITVGKWVKGDAVPAFEKGKVYVMEFWATWCGPCKTSIPHLTELAHQYKDITFIGTSVWEREDGLVEPFVKEMGDKMDYRVAEDDKSGGGRGAMAETWMTAAQQQGIPTAFIIGKDSTILWIGHPMAMEPVLKQIAAGTYNAEGEKKKMVKEQEARAVMQKLTPELNATVGPAMQKKDYAAALTALDDVTAKHPEAASELAGVKMRIASQGKLWDAFYEGVDAKAKAVNDDAQALNALAWNIVSSENLEKKDLNRAQKIAERAVELTKGDDAQILDTLANVYFNNNEKEKAIKTQEAAVAKAPAGELKTDLAATLAKYKAAK